MEGFIRNVVNCALNPGARILFWGVSEALIRALAKLRDLGLEDVVSGVVDHRAMYVGLVVGGQTVSSPEKTDCDYLAIGLDAEKEDVLRAFVALSPETPEVIAYGRAQYEFRDQTFWDLVQTSYARSRTGGYSHVLIHIYECIKHLVQREIPGDIAEFGVYKGGTTIFIARYLKLLGRDSKVIGFDTFDGFPPKGSVLDTYAYEADEFTDYNVVLANTRIEGNIELIKGDIAQTYRQLQGRALMLSFFDTDNYTATRAALPLCADQTSRGGAIVFDHYYSPDWPHPLGERMAAQEVLVERGWLNLHGTGVFLNVLCHPSRRDGVDRSPRSPCRRLRARASSARRALRAGGEPELRELPSVRTGG